MKKIKIVTVITLFLISLNGCKKSKEELEKKLDSQKDKLISESINSVYQLGSNGFAFLIDPSAEPTRKIESGVRKSVVQLEKVK